MAHESGHTMGLQHTQGWFFACIAIPAVIMTDGLAPPPCMMPGNFGG